MSNIIFPQMNTCSFQEYGKKLVQKDHNMTEVHKFNYS